MGKGATEGGQLSGKNVAVGVLSEALTPLPLKVRPVPDVRSNSAERDYAQDERPEQGLGSCRTSRR